jgi:CheY-like chemotaxis protein
VRAEKFILLVEDWDADVLLFREALKRSGLDNPVVVVRDGFQTMAYFNGEGEYADRERFPLPTVVLLDLNLPKARGWEVLQWIRSHPEFADILVVVLTGSFRVGDLHRAYQLGANSFLGKPCSSKDLVDLANSFPEHWRHQTACASHRD